MAKSTPRVMHDDPPIADENATDAPAIVDEPIEGLIVLDAPAASPNGEAVVRAKLDKSMRPLYMEIARLSQTLAIARAACYAVKPDVAARSLGRLSRQIPDAIELAEMAAHLAAIPEQS